MCFQFSSVKFSSVNFDSGVQIPARFGGAGPAHNDALMGGGLPVSGPRGGEIKTELSLCSIVCVVCITILQPKSTYFLYTIAHMSKN